MTLQTVPASDQQAKPNELVSQQSGFSLHAGVACKSNQRKKLERLCRYITRPAIANERLASNGDVIVALKTAYDDGTTHVVLNPMEFMGRLAALVPKPRVNLTRFHGVFSPNCIGQSPGSPHQLFTFRAAHSMLWRPGRSQAVGPATCTLTLGSRGD